MSHVRAPIGDRNRAQLLDAPVEIHHTFQGIATDMLQGVLKGATYEETLKALEDCSRDQHLAATQARLSQTVEDPTIKIQLLLG
jgi:hypothetical protein